MAALLLIILPFLAAGNDTPAPVTPAPTMEPPCPKERPYYNYKYLSCVECRTSFDCETGNVCYVGECSMHCPAGMLMQYQILNKDYYHKLNAHLDAVTVWDAYAEPVTSKEDRKLRQAIYDQIETFNTEGEGAAYLDEDTTETINGKEYPLPSIGGEKMPVCGCDTSEDFQKAVKSFTQGGVVGHPFSTVCACHSDSGHCETQIVILKDTFEMGSHALTSNGRPANCWGITYNSRWTFVGLSVVAIWIAIFAYRSQSNMLYDFHRLNLWNIIATWLFTITFLIDDPHSAGYTRFLGVGIFIHNAAEWNFMIRLWYGNSLMTRQIMSWWLLTFLTVMMLVVMTVPLRVQLVVAGALGASLDVTFLLMSFLMMGLAKENKNGCLRRGESCLTGFIFMLAYIFHFVALISIFNAMSAGDLSGTTWVTTLLATFTQYFLLELFAYAQNRRAVCCGPYSASSYEMELVEDGKYTLVECDEAVSAANDSVLVNLASQGDLKTSNVDAKKTIVYDDSVFPDGLNERARGCKECSCIFNKSCQAKCACIPPFAIYLTLGFIVALITNVNLFVIEPKTKGIELWDSLDAGDCPQYYPMRANRGIPNWILDISGGSEFLSVYGDKFEEVEANSITAVGLLIIAILLSLVLTMFKLQTAGGCCCLGSCPAKCDCVNDDEEDNTAAAVEMSGDLSKDD